MRPWLDVRRYLALVLTVGFVLVAGAGVASASLLPCGLLSPCPTPVAPPTTTTTGSPPPAPTLPLADPGSQYDGRAGNFTYAATVDVSKDGSKLGTYGVQFRHGHCSNGAPYSGYDFSKANVRVGANGAATDRNLYKRAYVYARSGHRISGREHFAVTVRFKGDYVDGTLTDSFRSSHLSCSSGTVRFAAYEDGTSRAPLADQGAATGSYAGKGKYGPWKLAVYLPWHVIGHISVHWLLKCPTKNVRESQTFYEIPITGADAGDGHFSYTVTGSQRLPKGLTEKWEYAVRGTLAQTEQTQGYGEVFNNYEVLFSVGGGISVYDADGQQVGACSGSENFGGPGPRHVPAPQ